MNIYPVVDYQVKDLLELKTNIYFDKESKIIPFEKRINFKSNKELIEGVLKFNAMCELIKTSYPTDDLQKINKLSKNEQIKRLLQFTTS